MHRRFPWRQSRFLFSRRTSKLGKMKSGSAADGKRGCIPALQNADQRLQLRLVASPLLDGRCVNRLPRLPHAAGSYLTFRAMKLMTLVVPLEAAVFDQLPRDRFPVGYQVLVVNVQHAAGGNPGTSCSARS